MPDKDQIEAWIEDALDHGNNSHSFEDIIQGVAQGRYQFWQNDTCCVVTEVIDYPKRRVLHLFLAAGSMDGIRELEPEAVEWAKSIGCTALTLAGRIGWTKRLKSDGWDYSLAMMEKGI